eukprot:gnl/TRDRNA2_/TRDRNA2_171459_c2_seq10.p1 gnl/TRDRNA2_/TRDRNA2_171459_c2~~gnl/TRDRNA2_/TRDRNA2_171459_c2_seq10.p1  ORF type:complete len:104 (+),score=13.37 gnl/TRDRNA2_/TRDRNA2_171459_c2_seq10:522-833(+)
MSRSLSSPERREKWLQVMSLLQLKASMHPVPVFVCNALGQQVKSARNGGAGSYEILYCIHAMLTYAASECSICRRDFPSRPTMGETAIACIRQQYGKRKLEMI